MGNVKTKSHEIAYCLKYATLSTVDSHRTVTSEFYTNHTKTFHVSK